MDEYAASGRWWVLVKTGIENSGFPPKTGKVTVPRGSGVDPFCPKRWYLCCDAKFTLLIPTRASRQMRKANHFEGHRSVVQRKKSIAMSDHFRWRYLFISPTFKHFPGILGHFPAPIRINCPPASARRPRLQLLPCSHRVLENHRKVVEKKNCFTVAICVHISWWLMVIIYDYIMLINGFAAFHTWKPVNGKVGSDMMSVSVNGKALKPFFVEPGCTRALPGSPGSPVMVSCHP